MNKAGLTKFSIVCTPPVLRTCPLMIRTAENCGPAKEKCVNAIEKERSKKEGGETMGGRESSPTPSSFCVQRYKRKIITIVTVPMATRRAEGRRRVERSRKRRGRERGAERRRVERRRR